MKDGHHKGTLWRVLNICEMYNVYNLLVNVIEKGACVSTNEQKSLVKKNIMDNANTFSLKQPTLYTKCQAYKPGDD